MSGSEVKNAYEAEDGTVFDVRYRGEDVDLYVAGDNTIIARPHGGKNPGDAAEYDE